MEQLCHILQEVAKCCMKLFYNRLRSAAVMRRVLGNAQHNFSNTVFEKPIFK